MNNFDFGYSWQWTHGHLAVAGVFALLLALAVWLRWRRWIAGIFAIAMLWAVAGFLIVQYRFRIDSVLLMPTSGFLSNIDAPAVLDAGAGSGRATVMVLQERPKSTVVALDIFAKEYGILDNNAARLIRNASAAGAEGRVKVQAGDMRQMPLADAAFDGVVSSYAIDHLDREGIVKSFSEIRRVLKPGGEFLLIVINRDIWMRIAYPLLHGHYFGQAPAGERWKKRLGDAGFVMMEQGTPPGTLYLLSRKPLSNGEKTNDPR